MYVVGDVLAYCHFRVGIRNAPFLITPPPVLVIIYVFDVRYNIAYVEKI